MKIKTRNEGVHKVIALLFVLDKLKVTKLKAKNYFKTPVHLTYYVMKHARS